MRKGNKLYIAYGSNMNQPQMAFRCPSARVVGTSTLQGWRLLFRGGNRGAVATIEPFKGGSVPVLVWEITPACEKALDRYEGFPHFYDKEYIKMRLNDKPVYAMVYIMTDGKMIGLPSASYYNTILEGYNVVGFKDDTLKLARDYSGQALQTAMII